MAYITILLRSIKRYFTHIHLRTKLLLIFLLAVFLPTLVTSYWFFANFYNTVKDQSYYTVNKSFEQAYSFLSDKFYYIQKNASTFARNDQLRRFIESDPSRLGLLESKRNLDSIAAQIHFIEDSLNISRVRIYVDDSHSFSDTMTRFFNLNTIKQAEWYKAFMDVPHRNMWISTENLEGDSTPIGEKELEKRDTLSYAVKLVDNNNFRNVLAIMRVDFSKPDILRALHNSNVIKDSATYILDVQGNIIAASQENHDLIKSLDIPSMTISSMGTSWVERTFGDKKYLIGIRWLLNSSWFMAVTVPLDEISSIGYMSGVYIILLGIGVSILSCLLAFFFSETITRRLSLIAERMRDIKKGRLQPLEPAKVHDEIGGLIDDYNYMVEEMSLLIKSEYLAGQKLKTAELKALQAQINPHFLYNTLELINWYAMSNDPEKIELIVSLLSKFYKLSLNKGNDIYYIWQELDLVSAYFEIQNLKSENRLNLVMDVPEGIMQFKIPKITLQPLVENSIKHGIQSKSSKTGTITISAELEKDIIVFRIADDGVGIKPEKLKEINEGTPGAENSAKGNGYGIQNINERIRNYYGSKCGLFFESSSGSGTVVTVKIAAV